jgi:hypothetical protein
MSGFIALFAVVCIHANNPDSCVTEQVTDSTQNQMSMIGCLGLQGQASAKEFIANHPLYHSWEFCGWRCQIGNRKAPDRGRA